MESEPSLQRNWMLWPVLAATDAAFVVVQLEPVPFQATTPVASGLQ